MKSANRKLTEPERLRFRLILMQEAHNHIENGMPRLASILLDRAQRRVMWTEDAIEELKYIHKYSPIEFQDPDVPVLLRALHINS